MLKDLFSMIMLKYMQCSDIVIVLFLIFCLVMEVFLQV